jgi:RNA polymerase sigma factor (sigma-70 family)
MMGMEGKSSMIANPEQRQEFEAAVQEYLRLVYAAARRQVGADRAEDLTQAVFLLLWQRWHRIPRAAVAGWLIKATRLAAMQDIRTETRRRRREKVAAANPNTNSGQTMDASERDVVHGIDEALNSLSDAERGAVVLRYLQGKSVSETAAIFGISEAAAAKRVSRGIEHLRSWFSRRGDAMPLASIGPMLVEMGRSYAPPAGLAGKIFASISTGTGAAGLVTAKGVAGALFAKKIAAIAATLLLVGGIWFGIQLAQGLVMAQNGPASQPAAGKPIKVGVTVSAWTAETNSPSGKPWGYTVQTRIAAELRAPDIELYPIIEPGSQDKVEQIAALKAAYPNRPVIDGGDPDALKQLDVIVAHEDWMVPDEVLAAFDKAVDGGVSLLNIGGMGWATPGIRGNDPRPARLAGLTEGQGGSTPEGPVTCDVLLAHDILGPIGMKTTVQLKPLGAFGQLPADAIPLVKVRDTSKIQTRGPADQVADYSFYPIYISQLGKGKIVGIHVALFKPEVAKERPGLLKRSVRWLAGRPVS